MHNLDQTIVDLRNWTCSSEIFTEPGLMVLITSYKAQLVLYQAAFVAQMKLASLRNQAEFSDKELSSEKTFKN